MQVPHYGLFVAASAVLFATPGPALLYVVARSLEQGRAAGLISTCGVQTGTLVHVAAAVAGIAALLSSSVLALGVLRWAGAAFLVYLGLRELTGGAPAAAPAPATIAVHAQAGAGSHAPEETGAPYPPADHGASPAAAARPLFRRLFTQGVLVNVLNPKVALFLLAFMPQFVDASRGAAWRQMALLGLTFVALGLAIDSLFALAAGTAGGWLRGSSRFERGARYVTGTLYLGLGLAAAFSPAARWAGAAALGGGGPR